MGGWYFYLTNDLFSTFFSLILTCTAARRGRGVHAGILQYLNEFAAKCANVLLDLIHVVLCDTLAFRFPLLHSDVSSYQISHDALVPEVPLGSLFHLPLRKESDIESVTFQEILLHVRSVQCIPDCRTTMSNRGLALANTYSSHPWQKSCKKLTSQCSAISPFYNFRVLYVYFNSQVANLLR